MAAMTIATPVALAGARPLKATLSRRAVSARATPVRAAPRGALQVRAAIASRVVGGRAEPGAPRPLGLRSDLSWFAGAFVVLWVLRDGVLLGDAGFHLRLPQSGGRYVFPDLGATWLMSASVRGAGALGLAPLTILQIVLTVAGAATVAVLRRALHTLFDTTADRAAVIPPA